VDEPEQAGASDNEACADERPAASFGERVLAWYARHGRTQLPWQQPATPYRVWISEIMLQQTRVETVRAYFERFMQRFPDVEALAAAPVDDVLALWAGLGYYARARHLHRAAQRMVAEHGGEVPLEFEALVDLPGIGRSTAGAILSLAAGQRHAILDGNVKRVLARHIGLAEWPGRAPAERTLWQAAEARTPRERVGAYNQAMMDLGAQVCLRRPLCHACPVGADCHAAREGTTDRIPAPRPKRSVPQREWAVLALQRRSDGAILLARRPSQGVWGGLWCVPAFDTREGLEQWLAGATGAATTRALTPVEHAFTHFRLRIRPFHALVDDLPIIADTDDLAWHTQDAGPGGMPAPVARLVNALTDAGSGLPT
jgi:A/G-specific adenine glycosylase